MSSCELRHLGIAAFVASLLCAPRACPAAQSASAQGAASARALLRGRVVRANGEAWRGASVVVVGVASSLCPGARAERLRARTDARGRFRLRVLPAFEYAAWAFDDAGTEGGASRSFAQTRVVDGLVAGAMVKLVESARERRVEAITLRGLRAWKRFGPLRFALQSSELRGARLPVQAASGADEDEARFGAAPWPASSLVAFGREDRALFEVSFTRASELSGVLRAPRPQAVELDVRGAKGAEAGARILQAFDSVWRELGRTGADGKCRVYPTLRSPGARSYSFVAVPEEGSLTLSKAGVTIEPCVDDEDAPADPVEVSITCVSKGARLRGRLFADAESAAGGARLRFFVSCPTSKNSWHHRRDAFEVVTRPDGSFEVPGVPTGCQWMLFYVDPAGEVALTLLASGSDVKQPDLGDLRLSDLRTRRFAVVEPGGAPASFAHTLVGVDKRAGGIGLFNEFALRLDRRGTCVLRALSFENLVVGFLHRGAFAQLEPAEQSSELASVRLSEIAVVRGRVVDEAGEPLAGIQIRGVIRSNDRRWSLLGRASRDGLRVKTRADGSFELRCPLGSRLRIVGELQSRTQRVRSSAFEIVASEAHVELDDIRIQVPRKGARGPARKAAPNAVRRGKR